jgi:hypothetical protein
LGIKRLGERHGPERLEAACRKALERESASYQTVKSILIQRLDQHGLTETAGAERPVIRHDNVRGAQYYQPGNGDQGGI